MNLENTSLYYSDTCSYCKRVLRFMEKSNITCELKNIDEDENKDELIKLGGKRQVPCLIEDGHAMYESMDIINHLNSLL